MIFTCCFDHVEDVDECKEKLACQCPECACKNTWGSYECRCSNGLFYVRESDMCIGESEVFFSFFSNLILFLPLTIYVHHFILLVQPLKLEKESSVV
jgi:hypothetical protein